MAEATIDELQIEISSDSDSAAQSIDDFAQSLSRLIAPVQALTGSGSGLAKLSKQIEKLSELTAKISNLTGFEKVTQAANALKSLDNLSGAPNIGSYTKALNKLAQANSSVQAIASFPDITYQLTALSNALNMLRYVQDIKLSSLMNALNMLPTAVQAINNMPDIDAAKVQSLNDALAPLSETNIKQVNSFIRAIDKLPTVAQKLNQLDFTTFSNDIKQFIQTLEPLIQRVQDAAAGLTALAQILQYTRGQTSDSNGLGDLGKKLGNLSLKSLLSWATLIKLKKALTECFEASSQFVENLNLFNVTMGKSADAAMEFAEKVNDALGIDTSDWVRYQGFFQSIGKGFGVVSNKADLMSQNLTQLAYDISSFYNLSVEEAYNKVQSGFAGELEPLRRLGFALDEATLKQLAYKKGITQTFESMTQAQKAQLRYVAMIEQAQNIGVTGDMSRTIDTAANGVRVLQARIQQFCRAIGNMLMPMLSAVLPYLTAFVQVMTDAANHLAGLFGFELPKIELGNISNGYDDVAAAADDATAATEKFKGSLAGVDQLNIIGSHSNSSGGNGSEISTDLNINLPTYDFLNGVESKTKEIAENMATWFQEALPWVEAVATAVGTIFAGFKIVGIVKALKKLPDILRNVGKVLGETLAPKFATVVAALAAGAASGILFFNSIKNLIKGTKNLTNDIAMLAAGLVIAGGAIAAFAAFHNPLGAIITAVAALVGVIAGVTEGQRELRNQISETIMYMDNGGISVSDLADGFSGYFDEISSHYDKILENTSAFQDNQAAISNAADEIFYLTDKYENLGVAMDEDSANKIKENLETIANAVEKNLGSATQTFVTGLQSTFSSFVEQLGLDVDYMVGKFYLLETMGNTALSSLKQHADELSLKIINGTATDAEWTDFNETVKKMAVANTGTEQSVAFERAIKEMATANIDFSNSTEITDAISSISNSAASAIETIENARNQQQLQLNNYKQTLTNLGVSAEYDNKFGSGAFDTLFTDYEKIMNASYDSDIEKINAGLGTALAMIKSKVNSDVDKSALSSSPVWTDYVSAAWDEWWSNGLFSSAEGYLRRLKDNHKDGVRENFSAVYDALDEAASGVNIEQYEQAGGYLIEGLANGALDSSGDFYKAIELISEGSIDKVKEICGIHSPSTVFAELGGYMMEGLAIGIERAQNEPLRVIDITVAAMIARVAKLREEICDFNDKIFSSESGNTDFNYDFTTSLRPNYSGNGYARQAMDESVSRGVAVNGSNEQIINLHATVECDGDVLGEAVMKYISTDFYAKNGR